MRIESCSFCSRPTYPSKGITFVRNDARVFRFCRSKCHTNFKMKRNPRKLGWTKMARHRAGKELVVDPSLALGARRNIPVRYDRNLVASALRAIPRINEIKAKRERAFYKSRMQGNKEKQRQANRKLVDENQHLLPPAMRNTTRGLAECEDFDMEKEAMESNRAEDMFNEREKLEEMKGKEKLRLIAD